MLKRNPRFLFGVVLVSCCLSGVTVFGQSDTATLSGTVVDPNGAVVPGVEITVVNPATTVERKATTDGQGYFTVPSLPPGNYAVTARHDGFYVMKVPNIVLNVGDRKSLEIELKVGDVNATVQVTSQADLVRTDAAVSTVVDRQFVENIPLNGRSFQSLISLTPGVVVAPDNLGNAGGQFSVNGQRASANSFMVDGVSANFGAAPEFGPFAQTSGNLPGLTAFGTTQSLVSVDAMQEFRVQTSTYAAEYGRQPGGQISIVTRSGTNQFHGSLFDYLRNDVFDANDWFANANRAPKAPERQNDFGGTFSGPFLLPRFGEGGHQPGYNGRNRSFFFFSYEGLRLRLPNFALTNVPNLALRQQAPAATQPLLMAFPLPNGRDLGSNGLAEFSATYSNPSNLDAASIRIDHTINNRFTIFGRYNQAPSDSSSRFTGNLNLTTFERHSTKTVTLGLVALLSPRVSNDLRANYSDDFSFFSDQQGNFAGAVPLPRSILIPLQYDSSSAQAVASLRFPGRTSASSPIIDFLDHGVGSQRQFNVLDSFSYSLGSHRLKFGADYRRLTPIIAVNSYFASARFNTVQDILNARAVSPYTIQANLPVRPIVTNLSAFGEDTWKLSRGLTVDFGVRWDVNPAPGEASGNIPPALTEITNFAAMQLASRGTPLWKTTYGNFAPRIGIAYQLVQRPGRETVLRGGFGVFYDTGNDQGALPFSNFPYRASRTLSSVNFPLNPSLVAPPAIAALQSTITPPYGTLNAFDPNLKVPYTLQWNGAIEQSLGRDQVITLSYVGSSGRRLVQLRRLALAPINPNFTVVNLTTNAATSEYNSLQAQFQKRLSRGAQALISYSWSHAIDDDSQSSTQRVARRGNADFDIRHNFAAALTYDIPFSKRNAAANAVFGRWSIDAAVHARSALPVDIIATALIDPNTGDAVNVRPNVVSGVPLYVQDPTVPGGRKINLAAFSTPAAGQSGSLGRNVLRGFAASQIDLALRRQLRLTEKVNLQIRAEAYNVLNHPNFGTIQTDLTAGDFGQANNMLNQQLGGVSQLYQIGGPRSFQFALKILF